MRLLELADIHRVLNYRDAIDRMRDALIASARGECETPMPMHLDVTPGAGEVHIKSSYRRGGRYFVLKVAATGAGMMLLSDARTGEPVAYLAERGHLTDVRTAAVSAAMARELGRTDTAIGILGSGIQAGLQAQMHAEVIELKTIWLWGRTTGHVTRCRGGLAQRLPGCEIRIAASPAEVARETRLIVTATASRAPLLRAEDIQPGTLIQAIGSDSPGKQELDTAILRRADLLLVDSRRQCEKLGELQHAPGEAARAIEMGAFLEGGRPARRGAVLVCDYTGLGAEDLYIAEYCYERSGRED